MSRRARARFDRRVILNPVQVAIASAQMLDAADRTALQDIIIKALERYRLGRDCAAQWCILADCLNVAETLSRMGVCSDDASKLRISAAQAALSEAHQRHALRGTWALRGSELQDLDMGVFMHRIQLEHVSQGEYTRAIAATKERLRQARAGNAPVGALVLEGALQ